MKPTDHDRKQFFVCLNAMRPRLNRYGISAEEIRAHYAKRFGVERMRFCTQVQWAVAAAEVQAMLRSPEVFSGRIVEMKQIEGGNYGDADRNKKTDQQLGGD